MMVDPTLSEMGRNLDLAMRILGDGQSEPEVGTGRHKRTSIPGPLQGNGQDVASILQLVHNLVHDEDDEDEDTPVHVPHHVGEQGHMALLGHSLAAYMCVMDRERLRKLTTRVMSDTTLWLCRLFRYENGSAYVHEDDREGLVKVCRLVINARYEDYATDGYTALRTSQPVIYQSATCRPGLGQHLCSQLGLPLSSLCTVPCNTMFGSHHQMDVALLDKLIKEDVEAGKCPLLLLANAGTPAAGHTDKLARLKELCEQYNMWLHVEGVNLATLVLTKMSSTVNAATSSNSMTLTLGPWLGLPAVPAVTLYRHEDPALSLAAGLTSSQPMEKLRVLPLWLSLQYMGHTAIIHKISHATSLSQQLLEELRPVASIRTLVEDELTSPVVVFRFSQDTSAESSRGSTEGYCTGDREVLDTLNTWLGEQLIGQVPSSGVDVVQLEDEGTCIRFRPLMTAAVLGTESMDVGTLVQTVRELVPVLSSTLRLKQDFREEVHRHGPSLRYVQDLSWPGLGAVRYEPQTDCMDESKSQQQVEHINGELLKKLQELDADLTFSSGPPCGTEQNCIFVGMATEDLDVCDLVETMMSLGTDIEESGRLLENMTDVVRKGILEAELQLQKANQDKLMEEGMLRQLPLVGSVLNWFSPVDSSIMGRTFNLSAGCLDSTESTYNTKAQMGRLAPLSTPTSTNKRLPGQRLFRRYSGAPLDSTSETSSVEHTEELSCEPPTPSLSVPEEEISQRGPEEAPGPQGLEEAPEPGRPEPQGLEEAPEPGAPEPQGLEEAPEPGAPEPQGLEEAPEPQVMEEAPEPGAPEPHVMEAPPGETAPEDGSSSNRQLES